jgi:hypothetical protein
VESCLAHIPRRLRNAGNNGIRKENPADRRLVCRFSRYGARWQGTVSTALLAIFTCLSVGAQEAPDSTLPGTIIVRTTPVGEESLIGENRQPEWTAYRRFPTTSIYVLPPWQAEFEQWWQGKFPRDAKPGHLFQSEIEIGLPHRFQLDLYENVENTSSGRTRHAGNRVEARWALAEWGRIPLNPTLYAEWKFNDGAADAYEVKLLLGEQLAPRWHWGLDLFYEQETGGARTTEWGVSQAVSYSALDSQFSVGLKRTSNIRRSGDHGVNPKLNF